MGTPLSIKPGHLTRNVFRFWCKCKIRSFYECHLYYYYYTTFSTKTVYMTESEKNWIAKRIENTSKKKSIFR